uniref:Uncharacterized protein n=1 Tax=Utricularia reniformis TaxID=192314 RepID=A0A1Y0B0S0_9LAMI|nr:hypothetical protein AEK19_MT0715 [Utricularia reniformis]ART30961.1 hypothetical protein AEK19_MT0715 [Utricularia reniformis]
MFKLDVILYSQSAPVRLHRKYPSMVKKITRCGQVFNTI